MEYFRIFTFYKKLKKSLNNKELKKKHFSKSISRVLYSSNKKNFYHLSRPFIAKGHQRSTPRHWASNPYIAGIHDLAAHGVHSFYCRQ